MPLIPEIRKVADLKSRDGCADLDTSRIYDALFRNGILHKKVPIGNGFPEFPKVKDTIPKSTLTLLPEHAVVRLLGIECQFLVAS